MEYALHTSAPKTIVPPKLRHELLQRPASYGHLSNNDPVTMIGELPIMSSSSVIYQISHGSCLSVTRLSHVPCCRRDLENLPTNTIVYGAN